MSNINVKQLDTVYLTNDTDNFLVFDGQTSTSYKISYSDFANNIQTRLKQSDLNYDINANSLNNISVNISSIKNNEMLILDNGSFINRILVSSDLSTSSLAQNKYVKISSGSIIVDNVNLSDITPSHNVTGGKFLKVDNLGQNLIESDFSYADFAHMPTLQGTTDLNIITNGFYKAVSSTLNKPINVKGYAISARHYSGYYSAGQIFISTDTNDIFFRRNDGQFNKINDFGNWYDVLSAGNHPIKDDVQLNSSTSIASSKAVKTLNDYYIAANASFTPQAILTKIKTVDGLGSGLDADMIDGYSFNDFENRFVNVSGDTMTGDLTINSTYVNMTSSSSSAKFYNNKIDSNIPIRISGTSSPNNISVGGLLSSNNYNDATKIPTSGIYSLGYIESDSGFYVNSTNVIDSSGKIDWNLITNKPYNLANLGTASQYDIGTTNNTIPLVDNVILKTGGSLTNGNVYINNTRMIKFDSYGNNYSSLVFENYGGSTATEPTFMFDLETDPNVTNSVNNFIYKTTIYATNNGNNRFIVSSGNSNLLYNQSYIIFDKTNVNPSGTPNFTVDADMLEGWHYQDFVNYINTNQSTIYATNFDGNVSNSGFSGYSANAGYIIIEPSPNANKIVFAWTRSGLFTPAETSSYTLYFPITVTRWLNAQVFFQSSKITAYNDVIPQLVVNSSFDYSGTNTNSITVQSQQEGSYSGGIAFISFAIGVL